MYACICIQARRCLTTGRVSERTFYSQSIAVYSNSQQVTLPRQWILYCSASVYVPLRIEGHLQAKNECDLSCSAKHPAAHVSSLKGCITCCSVLPDGMLMSVVRLAATADLTLQNGNDTLTTTACVCSDERSCAERAPERWTRLFPRSDCSPMK